MEGEHPRLLHSEWNSPFPSLTLLSQNCICLQHCAGFLIEFSLALQNQKCFQPCHLPNLLSKMVFLSVLARIPVPGWYKCSKWTNVGPASAGTAALGWAFENNELDCQSPWSARRENENPAASLLSLQLQLLAVATIQLKFPPVRKVFGKMECWDFFPLPCNFSGFFLASDALCLNTKVLFFFSFPFF